jgi:hypothetical protein
MPGDFLDHPGWLRGKQGFKRRASDQRMLVDVAAGLAKCLVELRLFQPVVESIFQESFTLALHHLQAPPAGGPKTLHQTGISRLRPREELTLSEPNQNDRNKTTENTDEQAGNAAAAHALPKAPAYYALGQKQQSDANLTELIANFRADAPYQNAAGRHR